MKNLLSTILLTATCAGVSLQSAESETLDPKEIITFQPYPLETCIVSDERFDTEDMSGAVLSFVHQGQEITICCKPCIKKFAKRPQHYMEKLEAAVAAVQEEAQSETESAAEEGNSKVHDHSGHKH